MKKHIIILAAGLALIASLLIAQNGREAGVDEFKQHFERIGKAETMRVTEFVGVEDGMASIEVREMSIVSPKKWNTRRISIQLNRLDPAFQKEVEKMAAASASSSKAK